MHPRRKIFVLITTVLLGLLLISCSSGDIRAPVYDKHAPSVKKGSSNEYRVGKGDTLFSIAWQNGLDYKLLAQWNQISAPFTIYTGQKISLLAKKTSSRSKLKKVKKTKKIHIKQKVTKKTSTLSSNKLKLAWQWPIKVKRLEKGVVKSGVVLVGKPGELIRSSEGGKVVYAGNGLKGYGNLLIVKHSNDYLTAYGYNKKLLVKEGRYVKKGQAIAEIGQDNKKRKILFFEMRRHGKAVSVTKYLPKLGR
ncbi:MAG: peptidoglycan DD-metalloendopeptidase family protein [Cycloclasticus sp.]|nr:peptidoglycan DD-metalloendopeptidase family protein [Cycloclasticus sp.]